MSPALSPATAPRPLRRANFPRALSRVAAICRALAFAGTLASFPAPAATAAFDPEAGLPKIQNFPPEVYRGHSQIFATARTADGVMYFGTYGAVVSYDGERWRQYPLPGTWTRALTVGPDGLVYVGGGGMLGRLEPALLTGELQFVSLADRLPAAQRDFTSVWSAATSGPDLFFAIDGALLGWRDNSFRVWPFPAQRPALRPAGPRVFCHVGDQLLRWHEGAWQPFVRDARLGAVRRLTALPADTGILLALDNGQIFRATDEGALSAWPTSDAAFLARAGIRNGLRLADGGYLLSTAGEGVVQLTAAGTVVRRLTDTSGLTNAATYGLGHAVDQHIWIETANGLSVFHPLRPWSFFDPRNGRPDAIGGEPIRIGRDLFLSMADIPPRRLVPAADSLSGAQLVPMSGKVSGRLSNGVKLHGSLVSGSERGIVLLNDEPRLLHKTSSQAEDIFALSSLPDVVVVGMLRGVELVRVKPDFTAEPLARVPQFEHETTNIAEARDRTVWIGSTAGVALRLQLDPTGAISRQTLFDSTRGLPNGTGWIRIQPFQGEALVIAKPGVFHLDSSGERLVPDPRFARHFPAGVNTLPMESDGRSRFWFQVRRPDDGFEFGCLTVAADGTTTWAPFPAEINTALGFSGCRSIVFLPENGREFLWVSGTRCSVRVDLDTPAAPPTPPTVVVSEIARGSQHWRPRPTPLRLDFSRDPLRIMFASPHTVTTSITYETRLLGYDSRWTTATSAEATFTNLYGGPFTLEVRARDAHGLVGEAAHTTFSIAPPWQRTSEAYVLYTLATLAAIAAYIRWRLGRAKREQRRLEALVATRTAELATARDAAEAASRAKSAFLASMSHELRTPLNGVIGYAQVLQDDRRLLSDQRERLRIVQNSGEHLLRMINDVLDLAKIEAGKLELRPAPFALADLIRDIVAAHAPTAAAKRLVFTTELTPDLPPWVEGDAQKLRQILDNLLGNAVKFTASGSVVLRVGPDLRAGRPSSVSSTSTLQLQLHGEGIAFAVLDTGPGIDAADQVRLFQPFEQATRSRPNAPGAGLGLAISRALVDRLGGSLSLTSEPGRGSTFTFSVPLPAVAPDPTVATRSRRLTGYDGPRRHVLIVDDHAINRSLLTDLLVPLGFTCSEFPSGEAALAHLASSPDPRPQTPSPSSPAWPYLAILDVRMQGLDGLELTRRLRALPRGASLKILLTSASVLTFDPAEGRVAGCDDFLPKPFRTADLVEKITTLLALTWQEDPATPFAATSGTDSASATTAPAPVVPLPPALRNQLRELLAHGDLDAFRTALTAARPLHPACEPRFAALEAAAAAFELSRLRLLLDDRA